MSRIEIEARFFLFTSLGTVVHLDHFCPETIDQEQMLSDLLKHYPLERWYEMQTLTREQVCIWFEQALLILISNLDNSSDQLV